MKMWPGAAAGVADGGDELPALHLLAELHVDPLQVAVARLQPVPVVEHEHVPIAAFLPGEHHRAVRGRPDRRPHAGGDVDPFVHHPFAGVRIEADREVRRHPAADRPDGRRGSKQRLLVLEVALQGARLQLLRLHLLVQAVELLEQVHVVRGAGLRVPVGDHPAFATRGQRLAHADRAHPGLRRFGGDAPAHEFRWRLPGLWLGHGELSFGIVEGGDVAEVRIQALDAVELVIDVRKLLLRLAPAVLQLQVLGANQLVFRDLAHHLEVVREGAYQRQHHHAEAEADPHEHPVLEPDLLHLRVPIRNQQDRVRLVQRTSVRREPIYPTDRARGRFPGKIQTAGQRAQRASVVQYRMATWCVKDCAPTSHYSSRCTAITVMLSSPPREFASWMSISGTWSSAVCTSASRISSLSIRFDSPSEQSRNLSPDRVSTPTTSTRTSSSNPTDRVMMFLRRLCFASSSVSRPARTCSLTSEWSSESCQTCPSRTR